jgi:hypothetical protein
MKHLKRGARYNSLGTVAIDRRLFNACINGSVPGNSRVQFNLTVQLEKCF